MMIVQMKTIIPMNGKRQRYIHTISQLQISVCVEHNVTGIQYVTDTPFITTTICALSVVVLLVVLVCIRTSSIKREIQKAQYRVCLLQQCQIS